MADDGIRWSVRRDDVIQVALFAGATLVFAAVAVAVGLWSVEGSSRRVFVLLFTAVCVAAGSGLGLVLASIRLLRGRQSDARGVGSLAAPLR